MGNGKDGQQTAARRPFVSSILPPPYARAVDLHLFPSVLLIITSSLRHRPLATPDGSDVPRGPVFFTRHATPRHRRRLFVSVSLNTPRAPTERLRAYVEAGEPVEA